MDNLFLQMFEAPGDEAPAEEAPPVPDEIQSDSSGTIDPPTDIPEEGSDPPPAPDDFSSDTGSMDDGGGEYSDDGSGEDGSQPDQKEEPPLDEKGEIFAKVRILKSFRSIYKKIDDTISTIDKIDLVQIGNNIRVDDVADIKEALSDLMEDVYNTIVYEFQQQYSNLKVKLVEYSSRYVVLVKKLVTLIKRDQANSTD